ncbi:MAG TPA: sirohydrochlorin chelatase [Candidatus Competibacteraceae bacterium]|nr:sirohydrochlorin chelatase [Candidatus Competibacteraceae bacterium]MCP5134051.1 sirohydrochlorin chelatase [Gammaproteobacteria bacterium]HPF59474.1 sirohydrochlorin chelatase [Candidatus Competibacteraceae bacterium]
MNQPSSSAVLLIGHGTRLAAGVAEFHNLANQLQQALPDRICLAGFLELVEPSVPEALETLRQQGFQHVIALPALLMAAGHIKNDIPAMLNAFQADHPEMTITFGADLGVHPNLLQVARERIERIETGFGPDYDRRETLLMVIGRGSSDPDANSNISKITRILWEGMGFGWAETAYTAVAAPLMADALERTYRLGFKRVIVFPYLLFTGRLVEQVQATAAAYQEHHPDVQACVAPYLNAHPLVVTTFLERLKEAEQGAAHMNCQFCPYRGPIIGREDWQGAPQTGHHHDHHDHGHHHHHHDH